MMGTCKGKIYKAALNEFLNKKGEFISSIRMTPQKRLSCSGCDHCYYIDDNLPEAVANDTPPIIPEDVKHNALYKLDIGNEYRDWETGIVEDWDLIFTEVKDDGQ